MPIAQITCTLYIAKMCLGNCWDLGGGDLVISDYEYTYWPWRNPSVSFQGEIAKYAERGWLLVMPFGSGDFTVDIF